MREQIKNMKIGKKLYTLVGVALVGMFLIGLLSINGCPAFILPREWILS